MFNPSVLKKKFELETLDESDLIKPKGYISTGNLAVNKIISGSMFRGIPNSRITTFYGESGCLPGTAEINVLIHADFATNGILFPARTEVLAPYLSRLPIADKLNLLVGIGYSITEISNRCDISRQTIYTLLRQNGVAPLRDRHDKSSYSKITEFLKLNFWRTTLEQVDLFTKAHHDFFILTPMGFRRCSNLIDKGEKDVLRIETDCGRDKVGATTVVSTDHALQLDDGKFDFAENVLNDFRSGKEVSLRTMHGPKKVIAVSRDGVRKCYDIEVLDDCHAYYADSIVAHNSGKSLIVSEIIINALNKENYDAVFYIDSEGGVLADKLKVGGIDPKKFFHVPMDTVENCQIMLTQIYKDIESQIAEAKGDESKMPKVLTVIDSLSGLVCASLFTNAENGKVAADMGLEAKMKNKMIKSMMVTVMRTACPLVCIAHAYDNMGAMGPQKFKVMSGGKGIGYASHIVVQSTKSQKRQEDANLGLKGGGSYYAANAIRYITYKNRLVKEGLETTMYVDLNKGISKYAGLWDDAIRHGFIVQQGAWYTVPSYNPDKKFRKDDIAENDEVWKTFLDDLDKKFIAETAYGTGTAPVAEGFENSEG